MASSNKGSSAASLCATYVRPAPGRARTRKGTEMSRKFARRRAKQSGQRFLDGSDPRLIRHAASCESAAGDSFSPSAGKD